MECPDENVFARVQSGLLNAAKLVAFHRHLDRCPACFELASLLGCIDSITEHAPAPSAWNALPQIADSSSLRSKSVSNAHGSGSNYSRAALTTLLVCHAYSSLLLLPPLWRAFRADVTPQFLSLWALHYVWLPYVMILGSLGLLFSASAVFYWLFTARNAPLVVWGYAILALATGFLAPMGLGVLIATARGKKQA